MSWWRLQGDTLVLELHVQPGAARTEVAGLHGERLKVRVAARAVEGEANTALIEFISERLGAARRDVTINAGANSRAKRLSVRGARCGAETLLEG